MIIAIHEIRKPTKPDQMQVISLINQKGGVGKTTLAIHLAELIARSGNRVILIDADPQGSALDWSALRTEHAGFSVVGLPKPTLHRDLPELARGFDWVVIDGPPRVYDVCRSAIMASQMVIIPIQPSPYDVWAAREVVEMIEQALCFNPLLKSAFLISRKVANTALGRDVRVALEHYQLPIFQTAISQRISLAETATTGRTVFDLKPEHPSAREFRQLLLQIQEVLHENDHHWAKTDPAQRRKLDSKSRCG
jgi:chromosome partitioning protein